MSIQRLKADKEAASLKENAQRLTELKEFLATGNNPGNRKRVEEVTEELKRIEQRLAELENIT
jgi:homoaconitase/3-isopropylmalate dehydratase large subunit